MDAPPIKYARTADGVNIAYWTLGEGPPLLCTTWGTSPRLGWEFTAEWLSGLASGRRVIGFDRPGFGFSDPDGPFVTSPESLAECLDAVADAVGLSQFDLLSFDQAAPYALAYTANRPERVNRMVVWTGYASAREFFRNPDVRPYLRMAPVGSHGVAQYLETIMRLFLGKEHGALAEQFAAEQMESANPEAMFAQTQAELDYDATPLLADIAAPLLVLHREACRFFPVKFGRDIAAAVAGAQLTVIPGDSWAPFLPTPEPVLAAINAFLSDESEVREGPLAPGPFRTLLFTDLESSTALTQALGDAKAQEVLHGHNDAVRTALAAHDGEEVKHTGDGIFAAFGSAVSAVEAALQIQRELAGAEVRVRVGLNAGEPIAEDDDYFGTAVQLAARVCDRAEPGQVLVSRVVHDLCAGKGFTFEDQGEATLKGFAEPVRLFVVGEMASDDQGEGA